MKMKYAKAFLYGLRDGWEQPLYLSSSLNMDFLGGDEDYMVQEWFDRGTVWGQRIRSPFHHQKIGE